MRRVRLSKTFLEKLQDLLTFGAERFGTKVAAEKSALVDRMIFSTLARHPGIGSKDEALRVYTMPVARTPFILLYDFDDDDELRMHLIVHGRADRTRIDLSEVEW